jgi:hypothetical protein
MLLQGRSTSLTAAATTTHLHFHFFTKNSFLTFARQNYAYPVFWLNLMPPVYFLRNSVKLLPAGELAVNKTPKKSKNAITSTEKHQPEHKFTSNEDHHDTLHQQPHQPTPHHPTHQLQSQCSPSLSPLLASRRNRNLSRSQPLHR